jgi:glycosyltransferase involved in cell wall biosynthesis
MIDIIIPVYSKRAYELPELLQTIAKQSASHLIKKIFICINPSSKKTIEIESPFELEVIYSARGNVAEARNLCLEKARSDYIAFLDSDVELDSTWLQKVFDFLERNPILIAAQSVIKPKREDFLSRVKYDLMSVKTNETFSYAHFSKRILPILDTSAYLVRSKFIRSLRFDSRYKRHEDLVFSDTLFAQGHPFGYLNEALVEKKVNESLFSFFRKFYQDGYYISQYEHENGLQLNKAKDSIRLMKLLWKNCRYRVMSILCTFFYYLGTVVYKSHFKWKHEPRIYQKKFKPSKYLYKFIRNDKMSLNPYSRFIKVENAYIFNNFFNMQTLESFNHQKLNEEESKALDEVLQGHKLESSIPRLFETHVLLRKG